MAITGLVRQFLVVAVMVLLVAGMYAIGNLLGGATTAPPVTGAVPPTAWGSGTGSPGADPPPVDAPPSTSSRPAPEVGPFGVLQTVGAGYAALTFDDGPDPGWTPQVLEVLRYHDVRATFCVLGENAEAYPDLIRWIVADGHTLCNHSWSHDLELGDRSRAEIEVDLARTNAAIRAAVPDARIAYFRQPGGEWTPDVVEVAGELGMASLDWTVDPQDWRQQGVEEITALVRTNTYPGSIVLLHDGGGDRQGTVRALDRILGETASWLEFGALPTTPPVL